jgi:hypothetical protein
VPLEVVISHFEEPSVPVPSKTLQEPFIFYFLFFERTLSIMAGYSIFQISDKYQNWLIEFIENHGYESSESP